MIGFIYNYFDSKAALVSTTVESVWCEIFHLPVDGKRKMQQTWQYISDGLLFVLQNDSRIRPDAFTEQFTAEGCADILFSLMLSALLRQDYNPAAVLEIVRRMLY